MGSDLSIVNAARVSFHKESSFDEILWQKLREEDPDLYWYLHQQQDAPKRWLQRVRDVILPHYGKLSPGDEKLIAFLARERHGSPFEQVEFKFRIRVPIFVAREWFRHRIGEFNEESGRYVEMRPDFHRYELSDIRTQVGKPGAYRFEPVDDSRARATIEALEEHWQAGYALYQRLLAQGIAREVSRTALSVALQTEFIWKANLRSLFNFCSLRTAPQALLEIRREAEQVEAAMAEIVPVAHRWWVDSGKPSI